MKFSLGLWDAIWGKKVVLEVPQEDGTKVSIRATQKWLQKMEAEGQISSLPTVSLHMLNLTDVEEKTWVIGWHVSRENYDKYCDPTTRDLYGMVHYERGEPIVNLMTKDFWEYAAINLGIFTGITEVEAQRIKTNFEELLVSRGAKPSQLFNR